ncbi:MAG: DUF547 domain-containing protein [Proteobacteria bacterium]|nr:DUF547 domain-containing protein [Pseudomonadota bacterium]
MKKEITALIISIPMIFAAIRVASSAPFDHSQFDLVLKLYVDEEGLVDYNGIAQDRRFSEYMKSLESANVEDLSRDGQLAFWINAYNAVTIDKVIKKKPKESVRETIIPGVWTSKKFFRSREHTVANGLLSQDDIEEILRMKFKDPRVHFAIICASSSCPKLPRIAYTERNVGARLEEETREYLNSERGIRIDRTRNTLYLSRIFDWYEEDFIQKSGSVANFIRPYLKREVVSFLDRKPKMKFLGYNWALNAQKPLR